MQEPRDRAEAARAFGADWAHAHLHRAGSLDTQAIVARARMSNREMP
jgi:hypothetical protein